MVNRLVLNLSHTVSTREDSEFRSRTGMDVPVFARHSVLGSIGNPVRTLPDEIYEDYNGDEERGVDARSDEEMQSSNVDSTSE